MKEEAVSPAKKRPKLEKASPEKSGKKSPRKSIQNFFIKKE